MAADLPQFQQRIEHDAETPDGVVSPYFALELAGFADKGRFTSTVGGRCSYGHTSGSARWHVDYEFARHLFEGFGSDNNELPQHRLRASWDWTTESGWSASLHVEGQLFDDETGYTAGFYVQRSF